MVLLILSLVGLHQERGKDLGMFDVSEAPQAYKDIEDVINEEST
jgi:RNA-splicing ligase RtcB